MFEWLFNRPLTDWQLGRFGFDAAWGWPIWMLLATLALALLSSSLWRLNLSRGPRLLVFTLQVLGAALLLLMLARPTLWLDEIDPGENTIAVVVDASRSLYFPLAPGTDKTRMGNLQEALLPVLGELGERFRIEPFRLAAELESGAPDSIPLTLENAESTQTAIVARTDLLGGLNELFDTQADADLAAVVLISDGADNGNDTAEASEAQWQRLVQRGVPIHSVGVGSLSRGADVELVSVQLPTDPAPGQSLRVQWQLKSESAGAARLRVRHGDALLAAQDIELLGSESPQWFSSTLDSGTAGLRELRFSVELDADPNPHNNVQRRMLNVREHPRRILYVEGEPRWEYKFIRRAAETDPRVELVSLLRTSANKFYRQGVQDPAELEAGFPLTREALFAYDGLIIGSLAAAELSLDQQAAVRDFVAVRGGMLLMLAGREGLAAGGWARSPVQAALPVQLESTQDSDALRRIRVQVEPSLAALRTPWLQLDENPERNQAAWATLPELADIQAHGSLKAGAVELLSARRGEQQMPLLSWHRYGQGQAMVMATSGTWRWQMSLPSDDQRHERFWQQLLVHMVYSAMPRISGPELPPVLRGRDRVALSLLARGEDYAPLRSGILDLDVRRPDGSLDTVRFQSDSREPGRFRAELDLDQEGVWSLATAPRTVGEAQAAQPSEAVRFWIRERDTADWFDTGLRRDLLQRLASLSGGSYLDLAQIDQLPSRLESASLALTHEVKHPLWNMPVLFLALLGLKTLEWLLRLRWKRL